jgi:hypothetical protein
MTDRFPISDVTFTHVRNIPMVANPVYSADNIVVSATEFAMHVPGTGSFYTREGKVVEYETEPGADPEWIKLYLKMQALVALMHQRGIISFHASSFVRDGQAVMILGESGAGKSSLTASFVIDGAGFLTDDVTPVTFRRETPYIMPLYDVIRLREHSVDQLMIETGDLTRAEPGSGKHYMQVRNAARESSPLSHIFKIEVGRKRAPSFFVPAPADAFALLRSEVCSWEILRGMPATEAAYMHQMLAIIKQVKIVRVVRPIGIKINELREAIGNYLGKDKRQSASVKTTADKERKKE